VEQAGGVVSAYDGGPLELASGRLIACSPGIHGALVEGLARSIPVPGRCFGAPELDPPAA
jgi:myo-inositol-1(or 4)-monophosphatase